MGKRLDKLRELREQSNEKYNCNATKVLRSPYVKGSTHTLRCKLRKGHRWKHSDGINLW